MKLLGYTLVALPFIIVAAISIVEIGVARTALVFSATILAVACIAGGVYLSA